MKNKLKKLVMSLGVMAMVCVVAPTAAKAEETTAEVIEMEVDTKFTGVVENEDPGLTLKFTALPSENMFYKIMLKNTNGNYCHVEIFDENRSLLETMFADEMGSFSEYMDLKASQTYYLSLTGQNAGVEVEITSIPDDVKDFAYEACELKLNEKASMGLQAEEDVDYFKFTTNNLTGRYHIILTNKNSSAGNSGTVYMQLFDKNEIELYYEGVNEKNTGNFAYDLEKEQVYYIKISSYYMMNYDLTVNFETYTITYNLDGGINHPYNPVTFYEDQEITLRNPSKRGSVFKGWYLDSSYNTTITSIPKDAQKNYTVYAKWEKINLKKPGIKSLKAGKKQAKIVMKSVKGAEGYEVIAATDKKFKKNVKTYTFKKANGTMKKLKKGKTYFVKARAYKMDSTGEKTYGKYGGVKKVRV